jgi:hypothetical protein
VVDDCTRECLAQIADTSFSGEWEARELAMLFKARSIPPGLLPRRKTCVLRRCNEGTFLTLASCTSDNRLNAETSVLWGKCAMHKFSVSTGAVERSSFNETG